MSKVQQSLLAFNRGIVSALGLARIDLKRLALSAQVQQNWMPRVLGSMMIRPGLQYIGATLSNSAARFLKFVFSTSDTALLEMTNATMRVWVNDALVTRVAVATTVANGTFNTDLTSWTQNDEVGGTSSWSAHGYMQLVGNGTAAAIRDQAVTVAAGDLNKEHALRIVIARGPVTLRVGTTVGGDDYIKETTLQTGTHSLALTPTGTINIRFLSRQAPLVWVDSCTVEAAGVMTLPTPWLTADLNNITYDQSADVVFVACSGYQQRRIERRSTHSWSVALYTAPNGPFNIQNVSATTIAASAITGNITLTASVSLFRSTHVGGLFSITSVGQKVSSAIAAQNTFTNSIRVTGIGTSRTFTIIITGTFVGTVSLQSSLDSATGPWTDVATKTWTAPVNTSYADGFDNQIIWYRIGIETGNYTSGTATCTLSIGSGSIRGIVRITDFTNSTTVGAEVLTALGGTSAVTTWEEGQWSDYRGWPTSVVLHEGRMWWAGKGGIWGSISDAYDDYDETFLGDAGPINRTIGSGPVDTVNWLLSLNRLIMGAQGAEFVARSNSFDEPLTPTNFNIKAPSTQGSENVRPHKIDQNGVFVNRSGIKLFELAFNIQNYDYNSSDLSALVPELLKPGITRVDAQRQPDTRIHCVRSDGVVALCVRDSMEDVICWVTLVTDGTIEDVVTLPAISGNVDDQVYYVVKRTINGSTVRYLEKMAQEVDCRGDLPLCKLADSFVIYTGAATKTITGLSTLEGKNVVVWADGADVGTNDTVSPRTFTYTVSGGQITLATAASNVLVGLPYTAQFESTKLGMSAQGMSPLNKQKRLDHLGLILAYFYTKGLQFGPDFTNLDDMPGTERGTTVSGLYTTYDENLIEFPGTWTTDARLCLQAQAPRPCTVLAATAEIESHG